MLWYTSAMDTHVVESQTFSALVTAAVTVGVVGHDAQRTIDGGVEAHVHVRFVRDVPIEEHAFVVGDAPAVAALRGERHTNDLGPVLRQLLHLLMALVGDVPI